MSSNYYCYHLIGCSDCKGSEVKQHLSKCPSRKQVHNRYQKAYIQPDCNLFALTGSQDVTPTSPLSPLNTTESRAAYAAEIGDAALAQIIQKMRSIAKEVRSR